jgi:peptide/nickel transport system substrate-binding protein
MPDRYDRREFLGRAVRTTAGGLLIPSAAAAFLEACGNGGGSSNVPSTPRKGGSLTFATEAEINSFDARQGAWDSTGLCYARTVFDPLFTQAADGSVQPFLAKSISHSPDYMQWTITLRPGITFHDGSPLDATVVKANLDGVASSPLTGPALFNLAKTTVVDAMTVMVTTKIPWVVFPIYLTGQLGHMAGLKQLADISGKASPIGTGPFVFKEWVPGDHFTATRNPNYWRSGLPHLDSITWKPIPDPQSRGNSLKAGNIDAMHSSDTQNVADFKDNSSYNQVNDLNSVLGEPDMGFVMLNTAVPPMNDIRVRQALAYATDQQKYINTLGNGLTKPADGPFTKGSPYYAPSGYPTSPDKDKAKQLVAAYQAEKGPITFNFGTINTAKTRQQNEFLQALWKEVGINTNIIQVEQSPYILNAIVGNYQAYGWRQFNSPDPDGNFVWWHSSTALPVGTQALNFARNKDPEIDAALITGRTNPDPTARANAYQKISARFAADIPYIWISPAVWIVAGSTKIQNLGKGTLPDGGKARGMGSGVISAAEIWRTS